MEDMKQKRQLAAIMFTDIVGYTALMGEDEDKAFTLLKKNRQIQQPLIEQINGKWLKENGYGGGFLPAGNLQINDICNLIFPTGASQWAEIYTFSNGLTSGTSFTF
jgi:hypothetical protein